MALKEYEVKAITTAVREAYRDTAAPVPTVAIATRCSFSCEQMRRKLNALVEVGQVERVGQRVGWLPIEEK